MRLTELKPEFLKWVDDKHFHRVDSIQEADGILFVCPLCYRNSKDGCIGVHSVICWEPNVPPTAEPGPGRWPMSGTGFDDLSLSPSILLTSGCAWHGYITNGEVTFT